MKHAGVLASSDAGLFGRGMLEDPHPVYDRLRATDPVHWDEGLRAWVLTRHADVVSCLRDPRLSSDRVSSSRSRFSDPKLAPLFDTLGLLMLQRDEPEHTRLRNLIHFAFKRAAVGEREGPIAARVAALLDAADRSEAFDFVRDFAVPLPLLVIGEIVGIPQADRDRVKAWCDAFSQVALNFYANIERPALERGLESVLAFRAYLADRVERMRARPEPNLLGALVTAEADGDRLTLDELLANTLLLLNAGNETTTALLGNGLAALIAHPEQLALLRARPELVANAVEEFLRFDSPVQFIGRVALEEIPLGGARIGRGDLVLLVLGAANRDPSEFPDPHRLDLERQPIHHLAFGSGHHVCAGLQLARLEARVALEALLGRYVAIHPRQMRFERQSNFNLRGFERLPIDLVR